jgi:hypothetical protein
MITHYDFATAQIVGSDEVAATTPAQATAAAVTRLRLLTVDEARTSEALTRRQRFDNVILESLIGRAGD